MKKNFASLGLGTALVCALDKKGYTEPTSIQEQAIPEVLNGFDLLATAQTGTGKTASFALPMIQRLTEEKGNARKIRALILTPTRELAEQIDRNIKLYAVNGKLRSAVIVGGVPVRGQIRQLQRDPAIVVATPGRLMDLLQQNLLSIAEVKTLVLDEADRMLDMGFIHDVKKIVAQTAKKRQTLLFSATMSKEIEKLSASILRDPKRIAIAPEATVAENLSQSVFFVEQKDKLELLAQILREQQDSRVLVFTRTKHRANKVAEQLSGMKIPTEAIHSNKSQGARRRALAAFDKGEVKVLVATDVVARGIDVKEISHVINFELPDDAENYVHRIGRTARAKQSGIAYSFCESAEVGTLQLIEKLMKLKLDVEEDQPFHSEGASRRYLSPQKPFKVSRGRQQGGGQRRSSGGPSRRKSGPGKKGGSSQKFRGGKNFGSGKPRTQSRRQAR